MGAITIEEFEESLDSIDNFIENLDSIKKAIRISDNCRKLLDQWQNYGLSDCIAELEQVIEGGEKWK